MTKYRLRDSDGGALVEMALVSPLFLLMMMGAFELGRVAHYAVEVENAARAGTSYGAQNIGNAYSSNVVLAAQNDAPDLLDMAVTPGNACVCETVTTSGTTTTTSVNPSSGTISCGNSIITNCTTQTSTSTQNVVSYVTVTTSAKVPALFIKVPGLSTSYTVSGYSALRVLTN
jgi:Flp pilus assembly protein TadG